MLASALTRRRIILGGALLATVVASVWPRGEERPPSEVVAPVTQRGAAPPREQALPGASAQPTGLPTLGERLERAQTVAKVQDLFGATTWNAPPPALLPQKPPPPTAPAFSYAIAGLVHDANGPMIILNRQNQDFVLRVGDVLEQTYRIEAIGPQSLTVTYLPLGLTQVVPIERF
jgi:hypothetical protein